MSDNREARLPPIDTNAMTPEQRAVHDAIVNGPRGGVRGPFLAWLNHPALAEPAQELGARLRFKGDLPDDQREIAILVTARYTSAQFEWYAHAKIALDVGVDPAAVDAIANRQTPESLSGNAKLVHDMALELHASKTLSDDTFARARAAIGDPGIVEVVMLCGYYTLVAYTLNVFDIPRPDDGPAPLPA